MARRRTSRVYLTGLGGLRRRPKRTGLKVIRMPGRSWKSWKADALSTERLASYPAWKAARGRGLDLRGVDTRSGWIRRVKKRPRHRALIWM